MAKGISRKEVNLFSAFTTKTIQLTIDLYQWQALPNALLIGFGIAAIAIIALIVVVGVYVTRKSKVPEPLPQSIPSPQRCPTCNATINGDETFCGKCGTQLK